MGRQSTYVVLLVQSQESRISYEVDGDKIFGKRMGFISASAYDPTAAVLTIYGKTTSAYAFGNTAYAGPKVQLLLYLGQRKTVARAFSDNEK